MNVEIGAEAVLFPKKEYINGLAVAVYVHSYIPIFVGSYLSFGSTAIPVPYVL